MQHTTPLRPYGQPMQAPPAKPKLNKGVMYCCAIPCALLFVLMCLATLTRHSYANGGIITQSTTDKMRAYRGMPLQTFLLRFGKPSEEIEGDVRGDAHLVSVYDVFDGYVVVATNKETGIVDAVEPYGNLPAATSHRTDQEGPPGFKFQQNAD